MSIEIRIAELERRRSLLITTFENILQSGIANASTAGRSKQNLDISALEKMLNLIEVRLAKLRGEIHEFSDAASLPEYPL